MRKRSGALCIRQWCTGRCIAKGGARWCRVPDIQRRAKQLRRHSKKVTGDHAGANNGAGPLQPSRLATARHV
jgi:hypothetical protein